MLFRYKIRVLDPVSGAVLIDPLPHPHQSHFEVVLAQPGSAGETAIGQFEIPLFPPGTDEYANAKADYDKLKLYARVEFYLIETDSQGAVGDPRYSGVITTMPKALNNFTLQGRDSFYLLRLARTEKVTWFPQPSGGTGGTTDVLLKYALQTYQKTFGQDKNTWSLGNFTSNDGSWTTATDEGFAGVLGGTTGDGLLYTSSYANGKYAECAITATFRFDCPSQGSVQGEVIAAVADTSNFVTGICQMRYVASNRYEIDAYILQKSGGVYSAVKSGIRSVITVSTSVLRVEVRLLGYQTSSTVYNWRLLINGIDTNTAWGQVVGAGSPTGGVGMRSHNGANQLWASQFFFLSKAAAFQNGTISTGNQSLTQIFSHQTNIDMVQLAATTENWDYRKNPKAGVNNDKVDFNATVGADLSASIRWEEGINLAEVSIEPNAEPVNTGVIITGSPEGDSDGVLTWYDANAIDKYGVIVDTAPVPAGTHQLSLRKAADSILGQRIVPDQAKRLQVVITPDQMETPGSPTPTGLRWREGDSVELHVPRLSLFHQKVKVIAYTINEALPVMEVVVDQYPRHLDRILQLDRLVASVKDLSVRSDSPGSIPAGQQSTGILFGINPYKFRAYVGTTQTVTANTNTTINFDSITPLVIAGVNYGGGFDTANAFNTSASSYTIPIAGFYFYSINLTADMRPSGPNSNLAWTFSGFMLAGGSQPYVGGTVENDSVTFNNAASGVANLVYTQLSWADSQFFPQGTVLTIAVKGTNVNVGGGLNGNTFKLWGGSNSALCCNWSMHLISV